AVVTGSANPDQAQSFVDYVTSSAGQATLQRYGFGPPPGGGPMRTRLPLVVVALAAIGAAFVVLPILALFIRAPWGALGNTPPGVGASTALRLSLEVSLAATGISLLVGVPLA